TTQSWHEARIVSMIRWSALDHHRRRLHDRGRGHSGPEVEILDRLARDDGDDAHRVAHDHLHAGEEPLDGDVGDDAVEAVPGAQRLGAGVPAEALDLGGRDHTAVRVVAVGLDLPAAIPAPE